MTQQTSHMDTSKQFRHVYACQGSQMHMTTGTRLLQSGDPSKCPECGAAVYDATNTPVGKSYFAFARPDLGDRS